MLKHSQLTKGIKKSEFFGDAHIALDTAVCENIMPNRILPEHLYSNDVFEIDIITCGSGFCQIFGQTIPCKRGDIFVIPSDVLHNCFVSEESGKMTISRLMLDVCDWFEGDFSKSDNARFCYGAFGGGSLIAYATLDAKALERTVGIYESILKEVEEKQDNWREAVRAELSMLFITLARYIGKAEHIPFDSGKEWHYAGIAVKTVTEAFADSNLTLETISDRLYISKSRLSRLFKDFTGETFSDYLRTVRLDHACKLLCETDMTVEQIANVCGMRDVGSFYKNFQNHAGKTPIQYRDDKKINKGEKIMVILSDISEKMQQGRGKIVVELVKQAIEEGCDPEKILNEGLLSGMDIIGEKFRNNEIFVPEVLVAARAMNMGAQILKPYLVANNVTNVGKVCLGTVHGDLHDIGKNIVRMMLEGKGLEVIDLGTDVPAEKFVQTAIDEKCDIICCSALLTTTMNVMADVVKAAEASGIRDKVKIMIGGAPVTEEFCKQIGADAYTADAATAANVALEFCKAK